MFFCPFIPQGVQFTTKSYSPFAFVISIILVSGKLVFALAIFLAAKVTSALPFFKTYTAEAAEPPAPNIRAFLFFISIPFTIKACLSPYTSVL